MEDVRVIKITLHLESNGEGKAQMQGGHCGNPDGRGGPALSHSCLEMIGRGWDDKDLARRIDRTQNQKDARIKGSCRSK